MLVMELKKSHAPLMELLLNHVSFLAHKNLYISLTIFFPVLGTLPLTVDQLEFTAGSHSLVITVRDGSRTASTTIPFGGIDPLSLPGKL